MKEPKFTRDGARFIVDQGHFGRFEYDARIEAQSILEIEKIAVKIPASLEPGFWPSHISYHLLIQRDEASLDMINFLSNSFILSGRARVQQLREFRRLADRLIVLALAEMRPAPDQIRTDGNGEVPQ